MDHNYFSICGQQSQHIINKDHTNDYATAVNQYNLSKVNEVLLGTTGKKFDGLRPVKLDTTYKCCECKYEHSNKYVVERHMGQLHGIGRLAHLLEKYEEKKLKNKLRRKVEKVERFSAEIGLPKLLEESQELKILIDCKKVELSNLFMENNGLKEKLCAIETKFTQAVNGRVEISAELQTKNSQLYTKVEELKSQLLAQCEQSSRTCNMLRDNMFGMTLLIQQLNGKLANEKTNRLHLNNRLADEKSKVENSGYNILQLRAENLSMKKKLDLCAKENEIFNLRTAEMNTTMQGYDANIAKIHSENEILRKEMDRRGTEFGHREYEFNVVEQKMQIEIQRVEGIIKFLQQVLKGDVEDKVKFVIPRGLTKLDEFNPKFKYFIFDTNVLLDHIEYIMDVFLMRDEDKLILPNIVTLELEHIKIRQSKDSKLQFKCRKVVRILHHLALLVKDKLFCAASDTTFMGTSTSENDKQLFEFALQLSKVARVCFVTCDKTLCLLSFPKKNENFVPIGMTCREYRNLNLVGPG